MGGGSLVELWLCAFDLAESGERGGPGGFDLGEFLLPLGRQAGGFTLGGFPLATQLLDLGRDAGFLGLTSGDGSGGFRGSPLRLGDGLAGGGGRLLRLQRSELIGGGLGAQAFFLLKFALLDRGPAAREFPFVLRPIGLIGGGDSPDGADSEKNESDLLHGAKARDSTGSA